MENELREQRKKEMMELRRGGTSLQMIGKMYDVSRQRVAQVIGNTGYRSKVTEEMLLWMTAMREHHMHFSAISKVIGLSCNTVEKYVKHIPRIPEGYKWCGTCKKVWLATLYGNSRMCRSCNAKRQIDYLNSHPDQRAKQRASALAYGITHPERVRAVYIKSRLKYNPNYKPRSALKLSEDERKSRELARFRIKNYIWRKRENG